MPRPKHPTFDSVRNGWLAVLLFWAVATWLLVYFGVLAWPGSL